ncbi:acyl-CoA dehydrogenase [Microbulbifer hainanensis]|uniref:acyl-CoA dehydrogenase n=1 Tax=Microbulbifer hainanensis TaxID=2735675 RepID=UPI0018682091|nr:acyl-CoA dehydrogenase [Microbulbifer hainanensis]
MSPDYLNDRDIAFQLYEVLDTAALLQRPRYQEHDLEVFNATLETAKTVAERHFASHYAKGDENEPTFDGETVTLNTETKEAWDAFAEAGFLASHYDFEDGGMQLPFPICSAISAYLMAANFSVFGYSGLTIGAANLIHSFGSPEQRARYLPPMQDGSFAGTMALTEPDQGSALADIKTTAELSKDGSYRIFGQKMFISSGDHELTDNIVHLLLARIKGAPAGTKGISLFIVPKFLVNDDGSVGERNDVHLAGLLHKMGVRQQTSTVLTFGEQEGAVGYLLGEPNKGLQYMFQMMNEARIGVGLGATALAYRGFTTSLQYAKDRPQGRLPSNKSPQSRQVPIIEHADVRRMLLAQKAYAEGALALILHASHLYEDERTAPTESEREHARMLLDLLTPVVKSWPSRYGVAANDLAIQVLGGSGYIREYPVEQLYRDNRLNPIHEGTEGIQGLDLLGRKLPMYFKDAMPLLLQQMQATAIQAAKFAEIADLSEPLTRAMATFQETVYSLMKQLQLDVDRGLANATLLLDMFGKVVVAWLWLRQAVVAAAALENAEGDDERAFYSGKLQAARYYIRWELPQTDYQAQLLLNGDSTNFDMRPAWY